VLNADGNESMTKLLPSASRCSVYRTRPSDIESDDDIARRLAQKLERYRREDLVQSRRGRLRLTVRQALLWGLGAGTVVVGFVMPVPLALLLFAALVGSLFVVIAALGTRLSPHGDAPPPCDPPMGSN
jgi:hypothetical protein